MGSSLKHSKFYSHISFLLVLLFACFLVMKQGTRLVVVCSLVLFVWGTTQVRAVEVIAVEVIPISRLLLLIIRKPCMCMHAGPISRHLLWASHRAKKYRFTLSSVGHLICM